MDLPGFPVGIPERISGGTAEVIQREILEGIPEEIVRVIAGGAFGGNL